MGITAAMEVWSPHNPSSSSSNVAMGNIIIEGEEANDKGTVAAASTFVEEATLATSNGHTSETRGDEGGGPDDTTHLEPISAGSVQSSLHDQLRGNFNVTGFHTWGICDRTTLPWTRGQCVFAALAKQSPGESQRESVFTMPCLFPLL